MKKIIAAIQSNQNLRHIAIISGLISLFNIGAMDQTIQVYGSEGESQTRSVPLNIAQKSETIKEMLQDLGSISQAIPLSNYPITVIADAFDILSSENPKNSMAQKIQNSSLNEKIDLINFFTFYDFHDDSVNLLRNFFDEHTLNLKDLTFQNLNHDTKRKILSDYVLNDIKNVMLQNILERKPPLKRSATLIPLTVKTGNELEFLNRIILSADNKSVIFFKELSKIGLFFTIDNHGNIDQSSRKIIDFSSSKKISCITFNHDGTKIFLGTMYDDNNNLEVYNLNNGTIGEKIQSIPMPGIGIKKIKLSPSGEKIFVIISAGVSKKEPHTLFEFTTKNGIIDPHPRIFDECQNPDELSLNINDIAINPNGDMTLVASKNFIYMLPSDNTTHQLRLMAKIANNNSISTLAFSPDGNTIALALFNRGIISMKIDNGIINNQSTWIDNAEATSLYFASNNILIASNLQNAQLYDLNKISQEQINIFAARPGIAPLMCGFFDIKLNARCTKIFAIEETRNHNLVCTYFNLITPEEEKMLTDLKNKLTIEEAQLIITLHQELIRGNKVHLSDADNIIYASLPAGIQILFANAIQKD